MSAASVDETAACDSKTVLNGWSYADPACVGISAGRIEQA